MTFNPSSSAGVATTPADDAMPAARHSSQRLTREQFEAAMRVMDARSASRLVARPTQGAPEASPSA